MTEFTQTFSENVTPTIIKEQTRPVEINDSVIPIQKNETILEDETIPEEKKERIVLSLNFDESNMPNGLMPLGEKITHDIKTNPKGHAGIDFTWDKKASIFAFSEGIVVAIEKSEGHTEAELWDIGVRTGKYLNSYTELEDYNRNFTIGKKIEKGEFIGFPWHPLVTHENYRMIHWNFGYFEGSWKNIYPDRLCPLTYFDDESKAEIEQIWQKTKWDHKSEYPLICNGDFENKNG